MAAFGATRDDVGPGPGLAGDAEQLRYDGGQPAVADPPGEIRDVRGDTGGLARHENGGAAAATKHVVPRALPGETRPLEIVQIVFGHAAGLYRSVLRAGRSARARRGGEQVELGSVGVAAGNVERGSTNRRDEP